MTEAPEQEIVVEVDADLEEIAPGYLEKRRRELPLLEEALGRGDFETLRKLGHDLKGTGGGYGFDAISDIGRALEQTAKDQDGSAARRVLEELGQFLVKVRVVYVSV